VALLGDLTAAKKMLRAAQEWDLGADIDDRLTLIQGAVTAALEETCGRTWGSPVTDTSRLMWAGPGGPLLLDRPARSVTSIRTGGTVSGSTMTGGTTTLATDLVDLITTDDGLVYAIGTTGFQLGSGWWGTTYRTDTYRHGVGFPVVVTGDFADTDDDTAIPADVAYAATFLIVERLKVENASPAGFLGPEGVVPLRDAWKDPMVKGVIERYSLRRMLAV